MPLLRHATLHALACVILLCPPPGEAQENAAGDTVIAIWRVHKVDFVFRSQNVYYACDALREKIRAILSAIGAHGTMNIAISCIGGQFVQDAHSRLTLALPAEATPANVRAATTFDTRAQLVARLQKIQLPSANDIARFPARWQTVSLSRQHGVHLGPGDCELLDGLTEQVFPKLPVHVTAASLRCNNDATRIVPTIEVTALVPAPSTAHVARHPQHAESSLR